jgi:hypothetical protein
MSHTVKWSLILLMLFPALTRAQVSVLTAQDDNNRTGANLQETTLTTANVNAAQFGKIFSRTVDGYIYAQPLYVPNVTIPNQGMHNVVYVATMNDSVFAFDADSATASTPLWQVSLGTPVPVSSGLFPPGNYSGSFPASGILSTPVINTATNTMYVVALILLNGNPAYQLHAIDITTGQEKPNSPALIQASVSGTGYDNNNGTVTFSPGMQLQRTGLLSANGDVYLAFGSYGDVSPYHGWILAYDATTLKQVAVLNDTANGGQGGIWQANGGLAADSSGSVYVSTGNGTWDGVANFGQSVLRLTSGLSVADWFTPDNYVYLNTYNLDVGSGRTILMPGTDFALAGGKQGILYVVNCSNLGQMAASNSQIVQSFQATVGEILGGITYWDNSVEPMVYVWGKGDYLNAYAFANGAFTTTVASTSTMTSPAGVALAVSSNGSNAGTGIVWASTPYMDPVELTTVGVLRAFDASNVSTELWDSTQNSARDSVGTFAKFAIPTVANGKLYLPTFSNQLLVYGLLPPQITQQPQSQTVGLEGTATFSVSATSVGNITYQWESEPAGASSFTAISGATSSTYTVSAAALAQSGTQFICILTNSVSSIASNSATLTVLNASNYITAASPGSPRNNFSGWVGMSFTVGNSPIAVYGLGRFFAPGDAGSHTVKIVTASNSQDLTGGSVTISMASGTAGSFVYTSLPAGVTLNANTAYYILSQETASGDQWYDMNTTVSTATAASETGAVWSPDGATYNPLGSSGQAYVPVDLLYSLSLPRPVITNQPQSQTVSAGGTATFSVTATGAGSYQWVSEAPGGSSFTAITGATSSSYTTPATTLAQSGTQYMCVVSNTGGSTPSNAATLTVTSAPASTNYVTSTSLGTLRNNFSGWVGMAFTVGNSPVTVSGLGRMFAPGDTGSHAVEIVTASNSQAVTGGSVTVSMAGGTAGSFVYANLPSTVTLNANTTYYILSQETSGDDQWYDMNTTITTTAVASEIGAVWSPDGATYNPIGSAGQAYVPVDFLYTTTLSQPAITKQPQSQTVSAGETATFSVTATGGGLTYQWASEAPGGVSFTAITGATSGTYTTAATTLTQNGTLYNCVVTNGSGSTLSNAAVLTVTPASTGTKYVSSAALGTLRNNFSGWVGMTFTVGSSPVTVSALGRMFAPGNTGSHTVEIVTASNNQEVAGGSVVISMSGGTTGSFVYANLPSTVALNANTTYYILTQEAAGGDQWYDDNTTLTTTSVASETGAVWSPDGATLNPIGSAGESYGPVDFLYTTTTTLTQPVITTQPQSQSVTAGATVTFSVTATGGGLTYQWQSEAPGGSSFTNITGATSSSYTTPATTLTQSGTQYMCVVTNTVGSTPSNAATLTVTSAPTGTNYVTSTSLGSLRSNFSGWVGMSLTVGGSPITVSGLGRMFAPGDTGSHTVEIVTAANSQAVTGGSVTISMTGGTAGSFVYANLPSTVTLNANTTYYILSQETSGGDQWYDINTTVTTSAVASEIGAVWSQNGTTYNPIGSAGQAYVPVDFLYTTTLSQPAFTKQPQSQTVGAGATATFSVTATGGGLSYQWESEAPGGSSFTNITGATSSSYTTLATTLAQSGTQFMCVVTNTVGSTPSNAATLTVTSAPASTNYVTSTSLGGLRNNFSGWVGMTFTVGSSPVTVSGLGRFFAPGDAGSHTVKIVTASNSQDLSGGSVSISMAGGTAGSFVYANLPSTVTLNANTTYYILSQEAANGDQWYDMNTTITTATVASETGAVWSPDGATYNPIGSAGETYGPVDFLYTTTLSQPVITQQPQAQTVGAGATATFSVTATGGGLSYQWESEAPGGSTFTAITGATSSTYTTPATTLAESGTQFECVVSNTQGVTSNAVSLTVTQATEAPIVYVTSETFGTVRNNYDGYIGMQIVVGPSPLSIVSLGRIVVPGNTGTHQIKIVNASAGSNEDAGSPYYVYHPGVDVPGGSVTVNTVGGTPGSFVYSNLASPITLNANTPYYILSLETNGGDSWYDHQGTNVVTTADAALTNAVYGTASPYAIKNSSADTMYGPVNFQYTVLPPVPGINQQPTNATVAVGQSTTFSVIATGSNLTYQWESEAPGGSSFTAITGATSSSYTTPAATLAQNGTQYMCVVTNTFGSTSSSAATLAVVTTLPTTNYVTSTTLGTLRNNFSGWVGMSFNVGNSPLSVTGLGRIFAPGNAGSHMVEIVNASNSQVVTGGSVSISMSGGTPGSFVYANLPATVTLAAYTTYYILTQETAGGDQWYDNNTSIQTTSVAGETSGVYSPDGATFSPDGNAGQSYGPVDFLYVIP